MTYEYLNFRCRNYRVNLAQKKCAKKELIIFWHWKPKKKAGGLCRSFYVEGHVVDIGGHFFQTKYKEVEDFIFASFPKEKMYKIDPRISKISIEGMDVDYPLESNLWQLPVDKQIKYLISVIRNGEALGKPEPKNYEEWIRWKLGDMICDNYLLPYNTKIMGRNS